MKSTIYHVAAPQGEQYHINKCKKQLKITKISRDGGAKKYTNKDSRENVRQGSPLGYYSLSSNCVSMKNIVRNAPCLIFSLLSLFVYFFALPSLLTLN